MNFKRLIGSAQYDFLRTNEHLGDNIVLLGLGGSHSYGVSGEGSDVDIRGIATRTKEDILLGRDFKSFVETNTDTTIRSVDRAFEFLIECNPATVELTRLKRNQYIYMSDIGQKIIDNVDIFMSKRCIGSFGGYTNKHLYKLRQKTDDALSELEYNKFICRVLNSMKEHLFNKYELNVNTYVGNDGQIKVKLINPEEIIPAQNITGILSEINNTIKDYTNESKRNNHAMEHGKINKHAMCLINIYDMANELLEFGDTCTYRAATHDLMMDIRAGKFMGDDGKMNKDFFDLVTEREEKFNSLRKITKLPDKPDFEAIEKLRAEINNEVVMAANHREAVNDKFNKLSSNSFEYDR